MSSEEYDNSLLRCCPVLKLSCCSDTRLSETADAPMHEPPTPTEPPTGPAAGNKKRPRLDLNVDPRERKRGKSMFGLVLGTLNKAKREDKERNASEAVCHQFVATICELGSDGRILGKEEATD
jgi:hypothetical protein